jgi:hypothetical protein
MKGAASPLILALALTTLAVPPARAATAISLSEYREQLRDLSTRVDALDAHPEDIAKTSASLPDEVVVKTGSAEVTVNYRDLKNDLAGLSRASAEKRPAALRQIRDYLKALNSEAEGYDQASDVKAANKKLSAILARREFQKVGGPSFRDLLLAKVFTWLSRILSKLAAAGGTTLDWFSILIYGVITGAVSVLAVWTFRRLRRRGDEFEGREIMPFAPSARGWRAWLGEARLMAQQQDWRNAIHLAYWAGISFLESGGAWKPNRARTPREYLRLMGTRKPEYPSLAALTSKFELVWYGNRAASALDFQETLGQLEKLGCR